MLIKFKDVSQEQRYEAISWLLQQVVSVGSELRASELDWAIKMEDAFNSYGNLSDRQLEVLVDILSKHIDELRS